MKKIVTLAASIFLIAAVHSQTRTESDSSKIKTTVKEPEYNDVFFLLDTASGNLIYLERQTLNVKVHGHGFGGAESDLVLKGDKSPIHFKKGQDLEFIVRVSSQATDPQG